MMLNNRQKCLYYFLRKSERCSKMQLVKIFFLMSRESNIDERGKFYSFVPYKFGPYSFELFHDVEIMEQEKLVAIDGNDITFVGGSNIIPVESVPIIDQYFEDYFFINEKKLINIVYEKYPDYTIFSKIKKKKEYVRDLTGVYTIGYEGRSVDEFLLKMIDEKIQILADVRNNPWSLKYGYSKQNLEVFCDKLGIRYMNIPSLGIPSSLRKDLNDKEAYEKLFTMYRSYLMKRTDELQYLKSLSKKQRIALMCFERDPNYCHRGILAKELEKIGAEVELN
ncbi:MAG: DUF488 family protein [Methanobacteriota archaeon]